MFNVDKFLPILVTLYLVKNLYAVLGLFHLLLQVTP